MIDSIMTYFDIALSSASKYQMVVRLLACCWG